MFGVFDIKELVSGTFVYFHTGPLVIVIVLYPLLSLVNEKVRNKEILTLMLFSLIYYFVVRLILKRDDHSVDINVVYFLIGTIVSKYSEKIKPYTGKLTLILIAILLFGGFVIPNHFLCYLINYNNIIYVLISAGMCLYASQLFRRGGNLIDILKAEIGLPYVGIYLLTDSQVFIKMGCPPLLDIYMSNCLMGLAYSILIVVVLVIFHRFLSVILSRIYDEIMAKMVLLNS